MKMIHSSHAFFSGSALRRSRMKPRANLQFAEELLRKPCLLDNKGVFERYCCEICAGWSACNFTIDDGPVEQPLAWNYGINWISVMRDMHYIVAIRGREVAERRGAKFA